MDNSFVMTDYGQIAKESFTIPITEPPVAFGPELRLIGRFAALRGQENVLDVRLLEVNREERFENRAFKIIVRNGSKPEDLDHMFEDIYQIWDLKALESGPVLAFSSDSGEWEFHVVDQQGRYLDDSLNRDYGVGRKDLCYKV